MSEVSFYVIRCITNITNSFYWKICYDRLHLLYPDAMIYIIDDFSILNTYQYPISNNKVTAEQIVEYGKYHKDLHHYKGDLNKLYRHWVKYGKHEQRYMPNVHNNINETINIWEELPNCTYIKSEYKGRGELLGYYYFYKHRPTKIGIVLHDSVFVNKLLDINLDTKCAFIWNFSSSICMDNGNKKDSIKSTEIYDIMKQMCMKNSLDYNTYVNYINNKKWVGCFGIMSVIDIGFLDSLQEKYGFFDVILNIITDRHKRQCLERIFGILVSYELGKVNVMHGCIKKYCKWGITYRPDMLKIDMLRDKLPITKVWTGR